MTEISKEDFLDVMSKAAYAYVNVNGGERELFGKVYMDYGKDSYDYPDGQPAFIDVNDYKHGDHVYLGEYLEDDDMQYYYEIEYGRPLFTIESGNPSAEPLEIMFLKPVKM